jgi:hypothetical protein
VKNRVAVHEIWHENAKPRQTHPPVVLIYPKASSEEEDREGGRFGFENRRKIGKRLSLPSAKENLFSENV